MNNERDSTSKVIWVAIAATFLLIFGSVWYASSLKPEAREPKETVVDQSTADPAPHSDMAQDLDTAPPPSALVIPSDPSVIVTPVKPEAAAKKAPTKKITPRDMFPMGDITLGLPDVEHPYRTIAELFPSFEYDGKLWSATGKYLYSGQAALTPTGYYLRTGQKLYALTNTSAPDSVLFVRSQKDPSRFAIYRGM